MPSPFVLRDLKITRGNNNNSKLIFESYLDGFSPNVQEILEKFKFRNQIPTMIDSTFSVQSSRSSQIRKLNLGPNPILDAIGKERLPGLDNHSMGNHL